MRKFSFFISFLCLCGLFGASDAEALKLAIVYPSENGRVLAPTRDFYAIGSLDREGKTPEQEPFNIRVELYRSGNPTPVRTITSAVDGSGVTPSEAILTGYGNGWTPGTSGDILASPPPDLVYDPLRPASIYEPAGKAVVTSGYFAALVQGGVTKDFDSTYATVYTQDLEAGEYTLTVSAVGNAGAVLATAQKSVTFGAVPDKVLARFSPADHMANVQAFAAAYGSHIYLDPFAGYWDASNLPVRGTLFYEIVRRWRPNDTLEYLNGVVRAIMYNINASSASQRVEIGGMAQALRLAPPVLACYYYDIGDPVVSYDALPGQPVATKRGTIVPFLAGDRLALTRAEIWGDGVTEIAPSDYVCSPDLSNKQVDWSFSDGVSVKPKQLLSLFGVVLPLQPDLADVVASSDGTYTVNNRIATVRYSILEGKTEVLSLDARRVELTRIGVNNNPSIYEFRHDLPVFASFDSKTLTVQLSAFDSKGNPVVGTSKEFTLTVASSGGDSRSGGGGGGCNAGLTPMALLLVIPLLAVAGRKAGR